MNRYFSLLGLREDAGKDDVKAAYERRVRKYRAPDYDDDPEYVRKKLAELKTAYEQAYRMAASGSTDPYRREDFDRPSAQSKASASSTSRATDAQQAHRRLHDQEEKEVRKSRAKRIRENEARKDRIEAEEAGSFLRRLDDRGGGTIIETPSGANARSRSKKEGTARHGKLLMILVLLIIIAVINIGRCTSNYDNYDDYDYSDGVDDSYSDYEDTSYSFAFNDLNDNRDQAVFDTAMNSSDLLFDTGFSSSWTDNGYAEADLQKQADRFAERYLEMEAFSDVIIYLGDHYDEFHITTSDPLYVQVTETLKFYGFMDPDSAEGYINPYKDETITSICDYLTYLNKYFDENGLTRY